MSGFYNGAHPAARQTLSLITLLYLHESPSILSCLFTSQIQTYSIMNLFEAPQVLKPFSFCVQRKMWYTILLDPKSK